MLKNQKQFLLCDHYVQKFHHCWVVELFQNRNLPENNKTNSVHKNCVGLTWLLWRAPLHFLFPNGFASTPRSALSLYPSPKRWSWHDPGPKVQYTPCTRRHTFPRQVSPVLCNSPYLSEINSLSIGRNILPLNFVQLSANQLSIYWKHLNHDKFWKLLAKLYK